jgi:hypothetical protein
MVSVQELLRNSSFLDTIKVKGRVEGLRGLRGWVLFSTHELGGFLPLKLFSPLSSRKKKILKQESSLLLPAMSPSNSMAK